MHTQLYGSTLFTGSDNPYLSNLFIQIIFQQSIVDFEQVNVSWEVTNLRIKGLVID